MKKLLTLLALVALVGCSSYERERGSPGPMNEGWIGTESSGRMGDLQERGEDTEYNAIRRDTDGSLDGRGETAPGGATVGPR